MIVARGVPNRRLLSMAAGLLVCLVVVGSVAGGDPAGSGTAIPGGPLTDESAAQLLGLPADTEVVACSPDFPKYPANTRPTQIPGYQALRPGRYVLLDGHCAFSLSAKSEPMREDSADEL
jgi:hypothetical protein